MRTPNVPVPPWRIKVVEEIPEISPARRKKAIQKAGYNTFLLRSRDVIVDLLTDSGTNGMYNTQRAAMEHGDEAYAGSESFYRFEKVIQRLYGLPHVAPTHQGRAAEYIASKILIRPGQHVLSNMYFTTSRAHAEALGASWVDISIPEAADPVNAYRFKGCIDTEKLKRLIGELGEKNIAFVRIEACLNMAGGQPFTIANIEEVSNLAKKHRIPLLLDATRAIENSYFIKTEEAGYRDWPIKKILGRMASCADWIVVSAKKDAIVNIGGFLCAKSDDDFEKVQDLLVLHEGFPHYGGLAGRDLEAIATGLTQAVKFRYIKHRVAQARYLGELLMEGGVPIAMPVGGHAVYLDARRILPHIPQEQFPAQALAAAIYEACGVRGMERGLASAGRDPKTGKNHHSDMELVRLTIPRLVYTESHLAYVAEGIIQAIRKASSIKGLKMVYEPERLRFFRARFEPI